jgi:hypothetical protein
LAKKSETNWGLISLIMAGISYIFGGIILSIPALVIADKVINDHKKVRKDPQQEEFARIARILAIVNIVLSVLLLIAVAIFFTIFITGIFVIPNLL